jgi:hypothetical protein
VGGMESNFGRAILWRKILKNWYLEGCMRSMQCNVEFGYQLNICSGTKENHGKPWSSWTEMSTRNLHGANEMPAPWRHRDPWAHFLENVGNSTSHNLMGLHGHLQG